MIKSFCFIAFLTIGSAGKATASNVISCIDPHKTIGSRLEANAIHPPPMWRDLLNQNSSHDFANFVSMTRVDDRMQNESASGAMAFGPGTLVTNGTPSELQDQAVAPNDTLPSISGVVLDVSGASILGAQVSLIDKHGSLQFSLASGTNGEFTFTRVPAGTYVVLITAPDLEVFKSQAILLTEHRAYDVPPFLMSIATRHIEVNVSPTDVIAEKQVKAEEKQRIFGILPNFYTSYVFDAAALSARQKYSLAFRDIFDPWRFFGSGITAAIQQANNNYGGYGQGAAGYEKRFSAIYGGGLTNDLLSHAIFPSLFHQDPRYFYQGSGSRKSRIMHAVSFAFLARSDKGGLMPDYSDLLGDVGSGALSNLYYPHANRGVGLVFTNAVLSIGGRAGANLVREFFSKRVTTNVHGDGKP